MNYPCWMYKADGPIKWGKKKSYARELAKDETECQVLKKEGYSDNLNEVLFEKPTKAKEPTKAEVMKALQDEGIKFNPSAKKEELLQLLAESEGDE